MTGRPPIPIGQKIAQGDTRQRGANRHAESLLGAREAQRGRPTRPPGLSPIARRHWDYLADQLEREGWLAKLDEGMLTTAAVLYSAIRKAAKEENAAQLVKLTQRYMQLADRMGLNESARVRLPKSAAGERNPIQSAMAGFMKRKQEPA